MAIPYVRLDSHRSVSQLGSLGSELREMCCYLRQEDNLLGLLSLLAFRSVSSWIISGAVSHHGTQRELRGAEVPGVPKVNSWKVRASFLQHRQGLSRCFLINSCLWGSLVSSESVSGGQGEELSLSCHFCLHLPHLIHSL